MDQSEVATSKSESINHVSEHISNPSFNLLATITTSLDQNSSTAKDRMSAYVRLAGSEKVREQVEAVHLSHLP